MLKVKIFESTLSASADNQFNKFIEEHPAIYIRSFQYDSKGGAGKPGGTICIMYEEYPDGDFLKINLKQYINHNFGTGETNMAILDRNEKKVPEEWVWVEGYKGTDKTLGCRGYQYEMYNVHTMPKGEEISECRNGFHFCIELKNVFDYYNIKNGNRFFRVRAEVKKSDLDKYYEKYKIETNAAYPNSVTIGDPIKGLGGGDKLAARSIEFLYELTPDDIFKAYKNGEYSGWSLEDKKLAMETNIPDVRRMHDLAELEELGYSKPFAAYLIMNGMFEKAKLVGSQKDLSMDMKVMVIFSHVGSDMGSYSSGYRNAMSLHAMDMVSSIGRR